MKKNYACLIVASILISSHSYAQNKTLNGGFLINSKPQGATVYIEGEMVGKTPCQFPYRLNDKYRLTAEIKGYEKFSRMIEFNRVENESISIPLVPKKKMKAVLRSFILPGWGQHYEERPTQGKIYFIAQVASLISLGISQVHYTNCLDHYNSQLHGYEYLSRSYEKAPNAWNDLEHAHSKLNEAFEYRQIFVYTTIGIYALNIVDSLIFFPKNIRKIEIFGISLNEPRIRLQDSSIFFECTF